jgi:hypothetical protein
MVESSFTLNITESSHVQPLLELLAKQYGWKVTVKDKHDLKWVNCNIKPEEL